MVVSSMARVLVELKVLCTEAASEETVDLVDLLDVLDLNSDDGIVARFFVVGVCSSSKGGMLLLTD